MAEQVEDQVEDVEDQAEDAPEVSDTVRDQLRQAMSDAAKEILVPAATQASREALQYAVKQGPGIAKSALPGLGISSPEDAVKMGVGKAGEMMSGMGGIKGLAGKVMSKFGGKGKGGGQATGYGKGRRMPVQQDVMVSLPVKQVYTAWTEYSRWPEYMHRVNGSDPQLPSEEGEEARLRVTEKLWLFTRPFTAQIVEAKPDQTIRWKTVEGVSHVGRVSFHELGPRLTLISVNLDHSPSGMFEKIGRGTRFSKRAVRADLKRFKGWVETREADELEEMEGWRGTIEGGEVTVTHDEAQDDTEPRAAEQPPMEDEEPEDSEEAEQPVDDADQQEQEAEERDQEAEEDEEADEEPEEEQEEEEEEPEPEPKPRRRRRTASRPPKRPSRTSG
jgi:uncharacterized membrane protein